MIEVEFKVLPLILVQPPHTDIGFRFLEITTIFSAMVSLSGSRRSVRSQGLYSGASVSRMTLFLAIWHCSRPSLDKFEGLGVFLDTYANSRHPYAFPRVTAMLGDGKTSYDQDHDGEANSIGACSVRLPIATISSP